MTFTKHCKEKITSSFLPYSVSVAFAMTYAGAHGETGRQMAQVLHFLVERSLPPPRRFSG
ncbi:serpin family protein [Phormidesmis priestleyi]|uniref:serpin family protein n=1 Tax=Phormidesmis priestleyi TaxID=268141 RepID=UPI001CB8BD8C